MVSRRQFVQAVPVGALSLAAAGMPWAPAAAAARSPGQPPPDRVVALRGDSLFTKPGAYPAQLARIVGDGHGIGDVYLADGAVASLEATFAALLGKEDAAFMPTGTMANQIAIRLLSKGHSRVLLQKESHVYRDEADAVAVMNSINPVPVEGGASDALYDGIAAAFSQSEEKPYPIEVGAVSIESPVRRLDGAAVSQETVSRIGELARSKGAGMHLDGARLLLMYGSKDFDVKRYCAPFDSVYVSLYKYLGAPFGAMLAGGKDFVAKARQARHVFGGAIFHGWMAAAIASNTLDGFDRRFARVREEGEKLLDMLAAVPGIEVHRVPNGTNIAFLRLDERVATGLKERLSKIDVVTGDVIDGRLPLTFNETLLRKPVATIAAAFAPPTSA
ncbi:threonine aldolase family protein [Luteibacter yeojuensis]|uniref:Low specificity L-threonine aldolase n=1 Tax=Luteibacter yeojuensis TaxID=345309 RepID=A0A7X5QV31_9GAMM|nr:low specificity L-threonine aldolase [Luteibacter yeojuensis]NID15837.1 low specificity L-threonine aldolase [Luteibacter yeojuensis]